MAATPNTKNTPATGKPALAASAQNDLQALYAQAQVLQRQAEEMERRRQAIINAIADIKRAQISVEAVSKNESFLAQVGSRVLVPVKRDRPVVLMEVGAGVIVEQTAEDAKHTLENRDGQLQKALDAVEQNLERVGAQLDALSQRAQQLQQQ